MKLLTLLCLLPGLCFGQSPTGMGVFIGGYRTNIVYSNLAAITNDLWTVPAGYRAQQLASIISGSTNANSTFSFFAKISGSYYRVTQTALALATNLVTGGNFGNGFVLEEGESLALAPVSGGANGQITLHVFSTNAPVRTVRDLAVDNTVRTLYTCPADKVAYFGNMGNASFGFIGSLVVNIMNDSGSARTYTVWRVPSGGAASLANVVVQNLSINDDTLSTSAGMTCLLPGDFVQVQSSSTGTQAAWINVIEVPNP